MKLLIMMPLYKYMDAPCVQSLVGFQAELYEAGHEIKVATINGFNAAKARIGLARHAGEKEDFEYDYVLWLDSDHIYKKSNFDVLLKAIEDNGLQMLSGAYKMRGSDETAHGKITDGKFHHFPYKDFKPEGEIIDCDVVGFGFLLMKGQFLKDMWKKYGEQLFKLDNQENGTEDVTFCRHALNDGHRVAFHTGARIGHMEICVRI